jgi:hypothetical protein
MMYFPYSLNSRNYARTGVIHQLSALCFVFSAAHAAPSNKALHLTAIPLRSIAAGELYR